MIFKSNLFVTRKYDNRTNTLNFQRFRKYNSTLNEVKTQREGTRRVSVVADMMKNHSIKLDFEKNKVSDILCYYMSLIYHSESGEYDSWFPETSCYNSNYGSIFPKMVSKRYFERIKPLFGVNTVDEFNSKISNASTKDKYHESFFNIVRIDTGLSVNRVGQID